MRWNDLKDVCRQVATARALPPEYLKRMEFEFHEIEQQATEGWWLDAVKAKKSWSHNKNGLILPWILQMTPIDPIAGEAVVYAGDGEVEMDAVEISYGDSTLLISVATLVRTGRGLVPAGEIVAGDEILTS